MVIGIVGQIANVGIRYASRYFKELHRYDVKIHKGLYGATAGRGVRHGRDAGIFISQYFKSGDDLDEYAEPVPPGTKYPSGKFRKAHRRYQRRGGRCPPKYNRRNQYRR